MGKQTTNNNENQPRPLPPASARAVVSLIIPLAVSAIITTVLGRILGPRASTGQSSIAIFLGGVGLISWFMGLNWYGIKEMGLRGGRPFFAGSGFAFLGWVGLLIARTALVEASGLLSDRLWPSFIYLLIFEGFAVHLWAFGVFFKSASDFRGPLSATVVSGLAFGFLAFVVFQESFSSSAAAAVYFASWGLFYGIVRLRTGSIIGIFIVQAMQSLTAWYILLPLVNAAPNSYNTMYIIMTVWYLILIWRLWPKEESDYRV